MKTRASVRVTKLPQPASNLVGKSSELDSSKRKLLNNSLQRHNAYSSITPEHFQGSRNYSVRMLGLLGAS